MQSQAHYWKLLKKGGAGRREMILEFQNKMMSELKDNFAICTEEDKHFRESSIIKGFDYAF